MSDLNVYTTAEINALTPITGDLVVDSDTNQIKLYNGTAWKAFDSDIVYDNRWGASFDGVDDYLSVAADASLNTTGDWSFSAWINANDLSSYKSIAAKRTGSSDWQFAVSSSKLDLYLMGSGTSVSGSTTFTTGTWYHVAFTVEVGVANGVKLFVNGTQESNTATSSTSSNNSVAGMTFGDNTRNRWWNGKLDEFAMFHSALSASDISSIYNNGVPSDLSSLNPLAWYKMGDDSNDSATANGSIATITDSSGNGNHVTQGTASAQPTFSDLTGETIYS